MSTTKISLGSGIGLLSRSLNTKLAVSFLAIGLVPLILIAIFSNLQSRSTTQEAVWNALDKIAQSEASATTEWLQARQNEVRAIAAASKVVTMDSAQAGPAVKQFTDIYGTYEIMYVAGLSGFTIYRSVGLDMVDLSDLDAFKRGVKGESSITGPFRSKTSGNQVMTFAAPVINNGKVVGVVVGDVPTTSVAQRLADAQLGDTGEAYLVNAEGYFITPSRFETALKQAGVIKQRSELELQVNTTLVQEAQAGKSSIQEYPDYRGVLVLGAVHPVRDTRWAVVVQQSVGEAYEGIANLSRLILVSGLITALVIVVIALLIARSITTPIVQLTRVADRISLGDVNAPIRINRQDEIGGLAEAFIRMQASMQVAIERLNSRRTGG